MRAATGRPFASRIFLLLTFASVLLRAPIAEARSTTGDVDQNPVGYVNQKVTFDLGVGSIDDSLVKNASSTDLLNQNSGSTPLFTVRAKRGGPTVRLNPSDSAAALSGLYFDTYLPVFGQLTDAGGVIWYSVRLWGALNGWIRADQTETGDPPVPTPIPESPSATAPTDQLPPPSAIIPLNAKGQARDLYVLRQGADVQSQPIGLVQPGEGVSVKAWRADSSGSMWYQVDVSAGSGWVWAGGVDLSTSPEAPRHTVDGRVTFISGKGMWLPTPLVEMASPEAIVAAAQSLGLSHIYLEAGDSARGFYGQSQAERLLVVAHRSGIRVIGWLLTTLNDIPTDLSLCQAVANYHAATGDSFDGIAPDVEYNMNGDDVRAFSEILRADLGSQALIVGVIYPVGTIIAQNHPIAGVLSRSVDALAPMAYWHDFKDSFKSSDIADFVTGAVADVHSAVGDASYPVEIIGQSYDAFSRNGAGQYSPTGDEVSAALTAARDGGAYAVSLFQWGTTTPAEWDALHGLSWRAKS